MATTINTKRAAPANSDAALRIVSKSPMGTFRRAGLVFGPEPTVVRLADLTPDQAKSIDDEPLLDVTETTQAPPKESAKA